MVLPGYDRARPCGLCGPPFSDRLLPRAAGDRRAAAPCGIRLRAERKAGDLLRDREKAKGTRGQLSGGRIQLPLETASAISASRNKSAKCPPRFAGFMSGARGGLRRHNYSRLKWATPPGGFEEP